MAKFVATIKQDGKEFTLTEDDILVNCENCIAYSLCKHGTDLKWVCNTSSLYTSCTSIKEIV